ncbi:hypothetical protein CC80DRAFT_502215 [Byssothecium circinans]|uniref:GPI anchored cell wall protein n=1 Tax=Byssothecium circinans TaxID=147558 RepID=A0A6A5U399_9PLEO|nr:hypothetical protein CC80DRAFT_502215 [Byssothecium circinans]
MKSFTSLIAATALFSTAFAASVKLEQTKCLQPTKLESFDVTLGNLVVKNLNSTCGLKLVSADGADLAAVQCQAYKDAAGQEKGSAQFNQSTPALISTNPVQIGSIKCAAGSVPGPNSAVPTITATSAGSTLVPSASPTGNATAPSGNGTNPSATNSPPRPSTSTPGSGAERLGLSLGVVAAGLAVFML